MGLKTNVSPKKRESARNKSISENVQKLEQEEKDSKESAKCMESEVDSSISVNEEKEFHKMDEIIDDNTVQQIPCNPHDPLGIDQPDDNEFVTIANKNQDNIYDFSDESDDLPVAKR